MIVRWFSFNPPIWLQAIVDLDGERFYLSAVHGDGWMDATIRCSTTPMMPIRLSLPLDVEKYEVEWMVEVLVLVGSTTVHEEVA